MCVFLCVLEVVNVFCFFVVLVFVESGRERYGLVLGVGVKDVILFVWDLIS